MTPTPDPEDSAGPVVSAIGHLEAALEINTDEPSGAFADEASISPPIGLTYDEAIGYMRYHIKAALKLLEDPS